MSKTDLFHNIEIGKNQLDRLFSDQDRLMLLPARLYGYVLLSRKFCKSISCNKESEY